jgi:ketosteroid isomerase-like protein
MFRLLSVVGMVLGLFLASQYQSRQSIHDACVERCDAYPGDAEVQRQEIVSLEKEAARAIQLGDTTFFRRVYNDDFRGTLSRGQQVDKNQWIRIIQSPSAKYDNFVASDITVHVFEDTAVATTLWSCRRTVKGEILGQQMRTIHVYINTPRGWHVVSGQTTNLPPDVQHDF